MDQDRTRLEHRQWSIFSIMIDDRRHPVVRADLEELRLELVPLADIDWDHPVFEAAFLEHDRDLPAVRRRPVIEVDHRPSPFSLPIAPAARSAAISEAE
jgi:hypothetical protein